MKTESSGSQALLTIGLITAMLWAALPLQAATNIKLSGVMTRLGGCHRISDQPGWSVCRLSRGSGYGWSL